MSQYSTFPSDPSIPIDPFTISIPQNTLDSLKAALNSTPLPRKTYENLTTDQEGKEHLGVSYEWITNTLKVWKDEYDWRKTEEVINSFPNFKAEINHLDQTFEVHFMALFSSRKDAVPVIMTHGWPGSFIEFVPLFQHLTKIYTPETLPVHLVVPSLIGFGFSSPPPTDKDFTNFDNGKLFNELMVGLGFGSGYLAQGGDIGSMISRILARDYESCKAVHLNFCPGDAPKDFDESTLDEIDRRGVERSRYFAKWEMAYNHEHATKTATIAMVVASSPLALLSWIGEKMLVWSDPTTTPSHDLILSNITLYYLTNTFPTSIYHYRTSYGKNAKDKYEPLGAIAPSYTAKPTGYSSFPYDLFVTPLEWAKTKVNLVWGKRNESGGHFAALERPEAFWEDVSDFVEFVKGEKIL